jgi:cold shock protein
MNEGTIKFFNEAKGFGFITPSNGGADLFVHVTGLNGPVQENDKVSYEVSSGQKGPTATNVNVI